MVFCDSFHISPSWMNYANPIVITQDINIPQNKSCWWKIPSSSLCLTKDSIHFILWSTLYFCFIHHSIGIRVNISPRLRKQALNASIINMLPEQKERRHSHPWLSIIYSGILCIELKIDDWTSFIDQDRAKYIKRIDKTIRKQLNNKTIFSKAYIF